VSEPLEIGPLRGPIDAAVVVPGSKSLTNRALALAALADGTSTIDGLLLADDTEAMLGALDALRGGYEIDREARRVIVHGTRGVLASEEATIDARRSGTTARFLLPILAAFDGRHRLTGTEQLKARPMAELIAALRALGARVREEGEPGRLPVVVEAPMTGGDVAIPGDVTSQFLSGLMLAAPLVEGGVRIDCTTELVSRPYVEMTAAVMQRFGAEASIDDRTITVHAGRYAATDLTIEPDASSASYFFAAAALVGGSVRVEGLTRESLQGDVGFVDVLAQMGAEVVEHTDALEVRGTGVLHGIDVDLHDLPDMALTVAALAPFANGPTSVTGVSVIRGHESDRIAVIARELAKAGVHVDAGDDGFVIHPPARLSPATIDTYDDHRVAMSFALLGLRVPGIRIAGPECVDKTFPGFWDVLSSLRTE